MERDIDESSVVTIKAEGITYSDVADGVEKGKKKCILFKKLSWLQSPFFT